MKFLISPYFCKKKEMSTINKFKEQYEFLSNFFLCTIVYEGVSYSTNEHAYQAAKCVNEIDKDRISKLKTPGEAKREGRKVLIRSDWDEIKYQIMYDICKIKFSQPYFKAKLLLTGDAYLEEGNTWHDNYWGVCKCGNCPQNKIFPKEKQNNLGKILMQIRDELK